MRAYISSDGQFHRRRPRPMTVRGSAPAIFLNGELLDGVQVDSFSIEPDVQGQIYRAPIRSFSFEIKLSHVGTVPLAGDASGPALLPLPTKDPAQN